MGDEMTTILRLVSEGKLSAEEAAPIIEALGRPERSPSTPPPPTTPGSSKGRRLRNQVSERGRKAVDVRVPLAFAAMAAKMVPGIPENYRKLIADAVETDQVGPIVDLAEDEDGDAVLISIE